MIHPTALMLASVLLSLNFARADDPWVVYEGSDGPGKGKKVVLISGDEEYRSEEALPQLAKILAESHGFTCTVLFAVDEDGTINPNRTDSIPGLESLRDADLMILATRFRNLPDAQMKEVADYVESGRPIIGLRTATHAFNLKPGSAYVEYSWPKDGPSEGGFGRKVLGETWINHHGSHGKQSTRGIIAFAGRKHPILKGIRSGDVWGPTDVYEVRLPLPGDSEPLLLGQVVADMTPEGMPIEGSKNDPMMPVAWVRTYTGKQGRPSRVFATTMGAASDLNSEGFRRLLVNASYWAVGLEDEISENAKVDLVGEYNPTPFGNDKFTKGVKPQDLAR